ncbi:MAG: hypothetical protein K8R56_00490 [Candidatus Eisenbacteria bacterium]|nr:hypothetical protein [Candidatus Eisenbacteria bacterium]
MTTLRSRSLTLGCALALVLLGSTPLRAQTTPPAPRPAPVRTAPVRDSLPSAAALKVLDRIPEPIPASQLVPPPAGVRAAAPAEAADSLRTPVSETTTDSSSSGVPVPAPTQPLTQPSSPGLVMPDTLPPSGPPAVAESPARPATPPADGACWRVQVAAPEQRDMAESRRDAAQSLLLVPMTIETEGALHKVRTRDCLTREAADAIKRRATDSGFAGVFLVNTGAGAMAPVKHAPAKKKPVVTTKRRKR